MMKKEYMKPTLRVVEINQRSCILSLSMTEVNGNASLNYRGGGNGAARVRGRGRNFDDYDDFWYEE